MQIADLIEKPTLLLDKEKAVRNIDQMVAKAKKSGVRLRPHFKTHQSAVIGEWFRERGVDAITVSSVDMAYAFARHGWNDITIAFPVNLRQAKAIDQLAAEVSLSLLLESKTAVTHLSQHLHHDVNVWLKIDVGYHRTGLAWDNEDAVTAVAHAISLAPRLHLSGLLTHAGHTYHARSAAEAAQIYERSVIRLKTLQAQLHSYGWETAVSVGDTPGCTAVDAFGPVDEVRPGNFIFFDLMQQEIGVCRERDIAVAVACPVVAKHADRRQIVIYGGAVHLSKEHLSKPDGGKVYGRVARLQENGWSPAIPDTYITNLSQEHGIIQAAPAFYAQVDIGDLLLVLPVHSCLTANLLGGYLTLQGDPIPMTR